MNQLTIPVIVEVKLAPGVDITVTKDAPAAELLAELDEAWRESIDVSKDAWIERKTWRDGYEAQPGNFEDAYDVRPATEPEMAMYNAFEVLREGFSKYR